jgi:hypothetical protein
MTVTRWFVVCLVLAGCGRIAFDPDATPEALEIAPPTFSTSSTEFVDIPGGTLTIPPSRDTTWLLLTSAALSGQTISAVTVEARYLVDGIERGLGGTQVTAGFGPWQHFYVLPGTRSAQTITYQLRDASGGTAAIDQLHAVAIPLPSSAELHVASIDDAQPITATTPTPAATLSLGALAGDYIVLLLVNGTELPSASDIFLEWRGPADEVLLPTVQFPREPWQSLLAARVLPLTTNDAVFTLYASTRATAQIAYARALAIRVDAFASVDQQFSSMNIDTVAPEPVIATQLSPVGEAAQYLYLASSRGEEPCTATPDTLRRLHFLIGSEDRVIEHATDNCSYQLTYGTTDLLPSRPARIGTGVSSGNGEHALLTESQVLLLGLP